MAPYWSDMDDTNDYNRTTSAIFYREETSQVILDVNRTQYMSDRGIIVSDRGIIVLGRGIRLSGRISVLSAPDTV